MLLSNDDIKLLERGLKYIWGAHGSNGPILSPSEKKRAKEITEELCKDNVGVLIEVDEPNHLIDVRIESNGQVAWVIQHSMRCRPDLFQCPYNDAMHLRGENGTLPTPGTYIGTLDVSNKHIILQEVTSDEVVGSASCVR